MTKSSSVSGAGYVLATRYAHSLIEVASQSSSLSAVENDMASLKSAVETSAEFLAFINNPVFSKQQKLATVQDMARRYAFHAMTVNFLSVLAQNGRLKALPQIIAAFSRAMENKKNIAVAQVVVAQALTDAQQSNLVSTLSAKTGKTVRLDVSIDTSLLGGMIVTVGSKMIDESLKTKLQQLKQDLTNPKAA